jgi:hypothetical protein
MACALLLKRNGRESFLCIHRTLVSACVVLSLSLFPGLKYFIIWHMYFHFENDHNCGNVNF